MKDFLRQNGILLLIAAVLLSVAISLGSALFGGTDPLSNLACVICIAGLFATRRFLIPNKAMKVELTEVE